MVKLEKVSVRYLQQTEPVLNDISLHVKKGEVVVLTGPSGCGKTTVLRIINGLIFHYYQAEILGDVEIGGFKANELDFATISRRTATVFQNPKSQFFNTDSTSELAFFCENIGINPIEIRNRITRTVNKFSLKTLLNRNLFKMSGGEKQKLACAAADVSGQDIIVLDEPSANLDYKVMQELKQLIRIWKQEGKTIIISEHRLAYLWDLVDKMYILFDGVVREVWNSQEMKKLTPQILGEKGFRSNITESPEEIDIPLCIEHSERLEQYECAKQTQQYLNTSYNGILLKNFSYEYRKSIFSGILERNHNQKIFDMPDIVIPKGKITAITGNNGVGKSTFLKCLCGLQKGFKGKVIYEGRELSPKERLNNFFMVMQDVSHQLFSSSVAEELFLCFLYNKKISDDDKKERITFVLRSLDLWEYRNNHPNTLSGGQKQRLALACAICSNKEVLLLDEPTSGLDFKHMQEVAKLFKKLNADGKTIIMVTHDTELIRACCDYKLLI